jgi:hypothetical protein
MIEDNTMLEKCFHLWLVLIRLSKSIDIVQVATEGLKPLTSEFKLVPEYVMGEVTLLPISNTLHIPICLNRVSMAFWSGIWKRLNLVALTQQQLCLIALTTSHIK